MKSKKKWIPKDLKKGAFTAWCKSHGYGGVTEGCITEALRVAKKTKNRTLQKRATLARTFRSMNK